MIRRMVWLAPLVLTVAAPVRAQDPRIEIAGVAGWSFADGVSGDTVEAEDGNLYNRIDPQDSFTYSLSAGYFLTENVEIGFLWGRQATKLEASGTRVVEIGDINIDNYHGYFAYNFGDVDAPIRPYLMAGLGATRYGSVSFTGLSGEPRQTQSTSRFSTTWGLGVKIYPGGGNFGVRAGVRWTPTYIKTDATGWWCDPWWGCYVVGNSQYANQFEFSGGINLRF